MDFLARLFDSSDFMVRWHCGTWSQELGWLHISADLATWSAYMAIPGVLAYFILRRKDVPFPKIFWLFVAFIFACGTVHLIEALIFWKPVYRLSGMFKAITAVVSWATVVALIPAVPRALALPGLAVINEELTAEVARRQQVEQVLLAQQKELEAANAELAQIAYAASHDLREPLRMIVAFLQLLEQDEAERLSDDGRQYLGFAVDGGQRLQKLMDALLAYSRAGRNGRGQEEVDVNRLVDDLQRDLGLLVQESGGHIERSDLPTVQCDPTDLRLVLQNLLTNAFKFVGDEPPRVRIDAQVTSRETVLSVHDNGRGIPEALQERIFRMFYRHDVAEGTQQSVAGTGIGLALAQKVVEKYGGKLTVASQPGEGATFSFTIPHPARTGGSSQPAVKGDAVERSREQDSQGGKA